MIIILLCSCIFIIILSPKCLEHASFVLFNKWNPLNLNSNNKIPQAPSIKTSVVDKIERPHKRCTPTFR